MIKSEIRDVKDIRTYILIDDEDDCIALEHYKKNAYLCFDIKGDIVTFTKTWIDGETTFTETDNKLNENTFGSVWQWFISYENE